MVVVAVIMVVAVVVVMVMVVVKVMVVVMAVGGDDGGGGAVRRISPQGETLKSIAMNKGAPYREKPRNQQLYMYIYIYEGDTPAQRESIKNKIVLSPMKNNACDTGGFDRTGNKQFMVVCECVRGCVCHGSYKPLRHPCAEERQDSKMRDSACCHNPVHANYIITVSTDHRGL